MARICVMITMSNLIVGLIVFVAAKDAAVVAGVTVLRGPDGREAEV